MKKFIISIAIGFIIGVIIVSGVISWWFSAHTLQLNTDYTINILGIPIMDVLKKSTNTPTVKTLNLIGVSIVGLICWGVVYMIMICMKKMKVRK